MGYAERRHLDRLASEAAGTLDQESPEPVPQWTWDVCPVCGSPEHWKNHHVPDYAEKGAERLSAIFARVDAERSAA